MKQKKVSKNTNLVVCKSDKYFVMRMLSQFIIKKIKLVKKLFKILLNQIYENYTSLIIFHNYVGTSTSMGK